MAASSEGLVDTPGLDSLQSVGEMEGAFACLRLTSSLTGRRFCHRDDWLSLPRTGRRGSGDREPGPSERDASK